MRKKQLIVAMAVLALGLGAGSRAGAQEGSRRRITAFVEDHYMVQISSDSEGNLDPLTQILTVLGTKFVPREVINQLQGLTDYERERFSGSGLRIEFDSLALSSALSSTAPRARHSGPITGMMTIHQPKFDSVDRAKVAALVIETLQSYLNQLDEQAVAELEERREKLANQEVELQRQILRMAERITELRRTLGVASLEQEARARYASLHERVSGAEMEMRRLEIRRALLEEQIARRAEEAEGDEHAQAELSDLEKIVEVAKAELVHLHRVRDTGSVSHTDLLTAQRDLLEASSNLARRQQELKKYQTALTEGFVGLLAQTELELAELRAQQGLAEKMLDRAESELDDSADVRLRELELEVYEEQYRKTRAALLELEQQIELRQPVRITTIPPLKLEQDSAGEDADAEAPADPN